MATDDLRTPPQVVVSSGATPLPRRRRNTGWRARWRADPVKRVWLQVAVGVLGSVLIIAAPLTGWLPGPGGIPLFLLGLAVLSSEFVWAERLRHRAVRLVHLYFMLPRTTRIVGWTTFFVLLVVFWYLWLVVLGVPTWMPGWAAGLLDRLPGV